MQNFIHLHVHSQYSILDGAAKIGNLVAKAKELQMPALALTDHGSMFGIKKFFDECKAHEIKPILGCEVYVAPGDRREKNALKGEKSNYHLIILAKNITGYRNLMKLVSLAWIEGYYYKPRIDKEILKQYSEGLIISSACLGGEIPQLIMEGKFSQAREAAVWYKEVFGDDFYLEIMHHPVNDFNPKQEVSHYQKIVNKEIVAMSKELNIKLIATNDVHFLNKQDNVAHDILITLNTGKDYEDPKRMKYTGEEYFKTQEEMALLFSEYPEALENTMEIAEKIEKYEINSKPIMPDFEIPKEFTDDNEFLKHLTYTGAKERYGDNLTQEIQERIDFELEVVKKMGFPSYFLIVWDFIKAAREMGISVGPGRGSAAGSVVAYCLKITDIDPIRYNLLFERFLNPDRISMPDIDIDFDEDGREKILEWVSNKYGHRRVAHIVTFGTMAPKMAIRDVARVLKVPLSEADRIAKTIDKKANTFKKALELSPEFKKIREEEGGDIARTLDLAETLDGSVRQTGVHACGTIIGKDDLENYVPLMTAKDAKLYVTQFDGKFVEDIGLLKMDFLGLRTLSIVQDALKNIYYSTGKKIDIDKIPLEDKKTFDLFSAGNTTGVFQFESDGMKKYLKELKPNKFEDLIAMNALYRPGPMDYIDDFIARKHGKKKIEYFVPEMEEYLSETYGITVYQEQVMLLSRKLAGFTRGQSDALRKGMGKKVKKILDELKPKFIEGCQKNNIDEEKAVKIWSDWEAFASYAFNKSHSTCYAYLAYQTGFLKAHYPAQFMAAVMSRNYSDISKISIFMDDSKHSGIEVLGPDVNESYGKFTVNAKGQIRFGLEAIKGLGEGAVREIVEKRKDNNFYKDFYDFVERVNLSTVNKRALESLIFSGALDNLKNGLAREDFLSENNDNQTFIDILIRYGNKMQSENDSSQVSIFGGSNEIIKIKRPELPERRVQWTELQRLNKEKEFIGIYLSDHPLAKIKHIIDANINCTLAELENLNNFANKDLKIAGIINSVEHRFTKTGNPFGSLTLEDFSGTYKIMLFSKDYIANKNFLEKGFKIFISAKVEPKYNEPDRFELRVKKIKLLDEMELKNIAIKLKVNDVSNNFIEQMDNLFEQNKGKSNVQFLVYDPDSQIWVMMTSQNKKIDINQNVINYLDKEKIVYKIS